jgi:1-acyl-sn-glycerol-3-phosphate acyltransferase
LNPTKPSLYWYCWRVFARLVLKIFFRIKGHGLDRVPAASSGGFILACNHQNYLDPALATGLLNRQCLYLGRSSLFRFAPFRWLIRSLGAMPIARGGGDRAALRRSEELLREGWMLNLFPEGTRTADGYLGPIKPGVSSLAIRAGVPVLPVFVHGGFEVWPRHNKLPRLGRIDVFYGELLALPDETLSRKARATELNARLEAALHQLELNAFKVRPLPGRNAPAVAKITESSTAERAEETPVESTRNDSPPAGNQETPATGRPESNNSCN